jgi:hypothetical protein
LGQVLEFTDLPVPTLATVYVLDDSGRETKGMLVGLDAVSLVIRAGDGTVRRYEIAVDVACRMKMTVLDLPVSTLETRQHELTRAIEMAAQTSLVDIFARFDPRLVRMAPAGEAPQD